MIILPDISKVAISVIPSRNINKVKIHMTLSDAKRAVLVTKTTISKDETWDSIRECVVYDKNYSRWYPGKVYGKIVRSAQIFTIVDNEWSLKYDVPSGTNVNDLPWKEK